MLSCNDMLLLGFNDLLPGDVLCKSWLMKPDFVRYSGSNVRTLIGLTGNEIDRYDRVNNGGSTFSLRNYVYVEIPLLTIVSVVSHTFERKRTLSYELKTILAYRIFTVEFGEVTSEKFESRSDELFNVIRLS